MKQLFLPIALFCSVQAFAQTGIVNYKSTMKFGDIQLDGVPPEMAAMMPKEQSEEKIMYFTPEATLYENNTSAKKEEPQGIVTDNVQIQIHRSTPDEHYYTDLKNQQSVSQKDLMGRAFLIREAIQPRKWKMTGNQKKILGHAAMEATVIADKDTITAWYTPEIPVAAGPEGIGGLPGLVLEANINKDLSIKATAITMDDAAASKIKEPTKGKKVSDAEYEKLAKQKRDELMQESGGQGGGRRVIIMNGH